MGKIELPPGFTVCDSDPACWVTIPAPSHFCHGFKMQIFFAKVLRAEDSLIVFCPLQLWFLICFRLLNYCTLTSSATWKNARLPDSLPTLSQKAPNTCNVFTFQKCFGKNHGSFPFTNASVYQLHFISCRRFLSASFRPQIWSCWPSPGQNGHGRGLNQHPNPQTSPFGQQTKERGLVRLSVS